MKNKFFQLDVSKISLLGIIFQYFLHNFKYCWNKLVSRCYYVNPCMKFMAIALLNLLNCACTSHGIDVLYLQKYSMANLKTSFVLLSNIEVDEHIILG